MEAYELEQITRLSLKVAELDRKIDFLLGHLKLAYVDNPPPPQFPEVEGLLRQGNKIAAIKSYQMNTGVGLAEAKTAVEAIERALRGR